MSVYGSYKGGNVMVIHLLRSEQSIIGCLACRTYIASLMRDRNNGATIEELSESAFNMCRLLTPFTESVCRGVVDLNAEALVYIMDARPNLAAQHVCGYVLQDECGGPDPSFNFAITVSPGAPVTQPKSVSSPRSPSDLIIVHITDLHYDEHYMEGGYGNCINPTCCRRSDGIPVNPADRAGFWGDYRVRNGFILNNQK